MWIFNIFKKKSKEKTGKKHKNLLELANFSVFKKQEKTNMNLLEKAKFEKSDLPEKQKLNGCIKYVGPCHKCGHMTWEAVSIGMVSHICGHPEGCRTHIMGFNVYETGSYYKVPSNCPLKKSN